MEVDAIVDCFDLTTAVAVLAVVDDVDDGKVRTPLLDGKDDGTNASTPDNARAPPTRATAAAAA